MDEQSSRELERRAFIKRAGIVAGATVWSVPTVQMLAAPAFAAGTPVCPPSERIRFKFDINDSCTGGVFSSGDAGGPAAECLQTVQGYYETTKSVDASGCYGQICVHVQLTCADGEPDKAVVSISGGGSLFDVDAKAGGDKTFECKPAVANSDGTFTADLVKGLSFVAGTICP